MGIDCLSFHKWARPTGCALFIIKLISMIVQYRLSWDYEHRFDHPVFTAYYDTDYSWKRIEQVFVDRFSIQALGAVFERRSSYEIKIECKKESLFIWKNGAKRVLNSEILVVDGARLNVFRLDYKVLAKSPFYNWDISIEDPKFSLDQLYDGVLTGLEEGLAAGLSGSKAIDGKSPGDFAWKFVLALVGTRFSSEPE